MDCARSIGANSRKEVKSFDSVGHIIQLLSIASKEYCSCARSVTDTYYIPLEVCWTILRWCKWLIVPAVAKRCICYRMFMPPCKID